jgi:site-specific DNA-cytosine methylase
MPRKLILSLCGGTGAWDKPYRDNLEEYEVRIIDPLVDGTDVRLMKALPEKQQVYGILAAPPCTHLSGSGARWWESKGESLLLEALSIVDACIRINAIYCPVFFVMENPVGRLSQYLGKPVMYFQPYEYAGWLDNPDEEAYSKKTCLWGHFNKPHKREVLNTLGSKMHLLPPSEDRWRLRSVTPKGFAKAFYESNR